MIMEIKSDRNDFEKIPLIKKGTNKLPNELDQPCDSKNERKIELNFLK